MESWTIIDKASSPEEFSSVVHHNEGTSNFAVKISNILQTNSFKSVPKFYSSIRYPFVCIYFENILLVFSNTKCDIVHLYKAFDSNISGLIIQKTVDSVILILENGIVYKIDLLSKHVSQTVDCITEDKFSLLSIYEETTTSFVLASNSLIYHYLTLKFDEDDHIKFTVERIKFSEVNNETILRIEIADKNIKPINLSSVCVKPTTNKNVLAVCPITNQSILLNETLGATCLVPFSNTDKFLFMKESHDNEQELCIANFYEFNIEYNIPVSKNCCIIGGVEDSAIYLDIKDNKIYIYHIQENSPLSQLEILIAARNYEGAEAFAKLNCLSPAAVLELKAKCLLANLKKEFSSERLQELKEILSTCGSNDFILNCCLEGAESDVKLSVLLEFGKQYIKDMKNSGSNEKFNELMWKTDIYKLMEFDDSDFVLDWSELTNFTPYALLMKLISNDQLDLACIVWIKCYPYIIHNLTQQNVSELLYSLSNDVKLNTLLRWLEYYIPNVIGVRPYSAEIIIIWARERTVSLENSKHWPEIGIQLAEKLAPLIFEAKSMINFMSVEAEKFYFLIHCLKNIQILKSSYNIIVSLKDYMTLSREELAKLILRKSFSEDLVSLLANYLEGYEIRHSINRDSLIKEHIEEVINMSPIVDENKMEILLQNINNETDKFTCILLFLKSAPIPWSSKVSDIAHSAASLEHELAKSVSQEIVNAEIKSILMKYKCHELPPEDYEFLIRLIIRKCDSQMLTDIEKITNVYYHLEDDSYMMCIEKYLKTSQINQALSLYNNMKDSFKEKCVHSLLLKLEDLLFSNSLNNEIECNHIDFLKSINIKDNVILDHLYSIYILKNKLNFKISLSEYSIEETRRYLYRNWCKEFSQKLAVKENSIKQMVILSIRIGSCLKLSKADCILTLLREFNSENQNSLASLIFSGKSCVLDNDIESVNIIIELLPHIDCNNHTVISNILNRILKILLECNYMHLSSYVINICSWIMAIYYSHNTTKEILSSWKISSFYNPHAISSIIPLWSQLMFKTLSINSNVSPHCLCKSEFCNDGLVCFKNVLSKLQSQQNDIHFSRILSYKTITNFENNITSPTWLTELSDNMVRVLISKMLAFEQPDYLNISMLMFCHSSVEDWLSEMLTEFADSHRKMNVAQYILHCKEMFQHVNIPYKQAFAVYSQNNIASKLEKYGISFKEYTQENTLCNINSVLEALVNIDTFNFLTLEEFGIVTGVSLDQALMFYLFSLLKSWNTEIEKYTDNYGTLHYTVKPLQPEFIQKCITIVDRIKCKSTLVGNLTTLFNNGEIINFQNLTTITVSQYSYEVFLLIIDLLKHTGSDEVILKEFMLLKFLQTYTRVSKPKQSELDVYSVKNSFPAVGYYRLPFQSLISGDCWSNLKSELTLSTYKRWLPIASLLPLGVDLQVRCDMICSSAVRESMTQKKVLNESQTFKWSLNLQNANLLKQAHKCIQQITNLEWAGACFYYVYQGSATGADQVAAANMCYQFAEHSSKIQPNNVLKKMQLKHLLTQTAHILHKVGLSDEKLLSLCDNPNRLIEALYNHDSILTITECPNINAAVDEIADANGLNSSTIRMNILERILNQTQSQHSHKVGVHSKSKFIEDGTLSKETLIKACYILKGTNPMMAALYLSRIGLDENDSLENYNNRIRALQCLVSLADADVIEKVTHYTVIALWSKLWELYFTNCLRIIGLEFLTAIFLENKTEALLQIWNAREHNHSTILFVIKIMFVYNIQLEANLLDSILKSMLKFGMLSEVKDFLYSTKSFYSEAFIDAWSNVLLNPFKQLDIPLTGNQKEECYSTLKLLPTCSVISQLDLTSIWANCIKVGALEMAAVILPHISDAERKKVVAKFGKIKPSLQNDIKTLKSKGILTSNIALTILKQNYRNRSTV